MNRYEKFLERNQSKINALEGALRTLTFLVPGRTQSSEFASEVVYSGLNLFKIQRDYFHALKKNKDESTVQVEKEMASPADVSHSLTGSRAHDYPRVAFLLALLDNVRLLIEMITVRFEAKHGVIARSRSYWSILTILELLRLFCRLRIFVTSGYRVVYLDALAHETDGFYEANALWYGQKTGKEFLSLQALKKSNSSYTSPSSWFQFLSSLPRDEVIRPLTGGRYIGELLFLIRPLIYVLLLRKYKHQLLSWRPWFASISLEALSLYLLMKDPHELSVNDTRSNPFTTRERKELTFRLVRLVVMHFLRQPMLDLVSVSYLRLIFGIPHNFHQNDFPETSTVRSLSGIFTDLPLSLLESYIPRWRNYYFSTN